MSIEKCINRLPTGFEQNLHSEDCKPLSLLDSLISIPQIFAYRPETPVYDYLCIYIPETQGSQSNRIVDFWERSRTFSVWEVGFLQNWWAWVRVWERRWRYWILARNRWNSHAIGSSRFWRYKLHWVVSRSRSLNIWYRYLLQKETIISFLLPYSSYLDEI